MVFINSVRFPGIPRKLKKYWLRILIFLCSTFFVVLLLLKWKYDLELMLLHDARRANMKKVQSMAEVSNTLSKLHDTWRTSENANTAIFSAYLDPRPEVVLEEVPNASSKNLWALIRIIAILDVDSEDTPMTCYYKFAKEPQFAKSQKVYMESPAVGVRIVAKTENFGMQYSAAFVLCRLVTADDGRLPSQIAFSTRSGQTYEDVGKQSFVDVHYTTRIDSGDQDRFMAACVPSLHHDYDKYANLIEFVEFYRMMGVEHFTFYNTSVTEEVSRVLAHYESEGLATVLHWQLPARYLYERNLRYNGIFAAMNDCLYRSTMVGGYKYVINTDLDEFIVPRKHLNFHDMMDFLDPPTEEIVYSSFMLRNMFFYLMHEDSPVPQNPPDIPKLSLHTKTTRLARINPAYDRSKYIARGQEIVEMGNHRVWQTKKYSLILRSSYGEKMVDPEIAGSQHYRYCEVNELVCWLRDTVIDNTAHRYTSELGARVSAVLKKILPNSTA
ncbi:uncharacterized protein LOC100115374 isoform X2 [Nasonia vitripennis]|uniref:Glycosyltransferase family 92 protein n=2 Tax=Nasonia vitripennis TaxID=7425 RepID=A0A7M7QQS0_NASVI|nr:uncharacterized protein LOC100115374 isoform X2 [Nasonia vitripennis]